MILVDCAFVSLVSYLDCVGVFDSWNHLLLQISSKDFDWNGEYFISIPP